MKDLAGQGHPKASPAPGVHRLLLLLALGIGVVGLVWGVLRDPPPSPSCGGTGPGAEAFASPIQPVLLLLALLSLALLLIGLRAHREIPGSWSAAAAAVPVAAAVGVALGLTPFALDQDAPAFLITAGVAIGLPSAAATLSALRAAAGRQWSWWAAMVTLVVAAVGLPVGGVVWFIGYHAVETAQVLAICWVLAIGGAALALYREAWPGAIAWLGSTALCVLLPVTLLVVESGGHGPLIC